MEDPFVGGVLEGPGKAATAEEGDSSRIAKKPMMTSWSNWSRRMALAAT
jgi:hypothetical protein